MDFQVSVIIPAYNAEKYIKKAIKSALKQPEVSELIIVNDGSTDKTLEIVKSLQENELRIKIYHHKSKVNKGRSASRNLGIKKAKANYIAFLDADDFYLPNRFLNDKKIFQQDNNVDGVYNAIGAHFYDEINIIDKAELKLYMVNGEINPADLFDTLLSGKKGNFSIDGLTVKRSVFDIIGFFNEFLEVAEDTEIIWKMALKCKLEAGIADRPLAIRGVHDANVFYKKDLYEVYYLKLYESLYTWSAKNQVDKKTIERFLERIWILTYKKNNSLYKNLKYWLYLNLKTPKLLFSFLGIKYFPIVRLRKKLFPFLYTK